MRNIDTENIYLQNFDDTIHHFFNEVKLKHRDVAQRELCPFIF